LIALIGAGHLVFFYFLARALAPEMTQSVEESVLATIDVTITAPPEEEEEVPITEPEPDEGAQGERASSTGVANNSGARESGDGTGAEGQGLGTGSGRQGGGQGGIAVTKPQHISGAINNARDYPIPEGGRSARRGTEVIVRVIVGVNGRASNCSVYRASPDTEADRITCQLVVDRLGFKPAQDANGDPVAAPFYWRQRWF